MASSSRLFAMQGQEMDPDPKRIPLSAKVARGEVYRCLARHSFEVATKRY